MLPVLRGADVQQSRVQDNVQALVSPAVRAFNNSPQGGAALPAWVYLQRIGGVTPLGGGFQAPAHYVDLATRQVELGGAFVSVGGLAAGDNCLLLPREARPLSPRVFAVAGLVGGVSAAKFLGVKTNGFVSVLTALAAGDSVFLDGIHFRVG